MSRPADPGPEPSRQFGPDRPAQPLTALRGLLVVAVVAAAGAPLGLLWAALAPEVPVRVTGQGPIFGTPQPEQLIAAEGWYALLAVGFGAAAAIGGWVAVRSVRSAVGLLAVTGGALVAGVLAWWVGANLGLADYREALAAAEPGDLLARPPDLRVAEAGWWPPRLRGLPMLPGLAAAATYTLLAAWSRFPTLRPEPASSRAAEPTTMPYPSWSTAADEPPPHRDWSAAGDEPPPPGPPPPRRPT